MASEPHAASASLLPSLEDIHSTVPIPRTWWRRFLAFSGPAFLVSVGYMDPGNWGTDIEAGSQFGYRLLWVLLMSNLMAVLLQSLATRLGVVTGRDLAQACRESYPRPTAVALWLLCEVAIAATDLAEVIGTVVALKLLFDLPYLWGLAIAACDTFLLLALQKRGIRLLEALTLVLVAVIGVSFFIEIVLARPEWAAVARGLLPGLDRAKLGDCVYAAIGMLGATVMPHNLYLHSALVQTRSFPQTSKGKRLACRYNFFDSLLALNGAFFVNAAILILAAAKFAGQGIETLQQAHKLLPQALGTYLAAALFAVALLASGQSSTLTGTLAGQIVMEGFVSLRIRPWARRLLTRSVALLPALIVISLAGREAEHGSSAPAAPAVEQTVVAESGEPAGSEEVQPVDRRLLKLLIFSQVVLSFQLPFAIVPLVHFTSDRRRMGEFANRGWLKTLAWGCALLVVGLNAVLIYLQIGKWALEAADTGWQPTWVYLPAAVLAAALAGFLGWVALYPYWVPREEAVRPTAAPELRAVQFHRIGVAVEFEKSDAAVLAQAAALARGHGASLVLVHVVEGLGAEFHGSDTDDRESRSDRAHMAALARHLGEGGLEVKGMLGYGNPAEELVRLARQEQFDLLVLGTHGHRFFADLALGQTVSPVLHRLTIPVLVVPTRAGGEPAAAVPDRP